jgi:hypothetical protein
MLAFFDEADMMLSEKTLFFIRFINALFIGMSL